MEKTLKVENNGITCAHCRYFATYTDLHQKVQTPICRRNAPSVTSQLVPMPHPDGKGMGMAWQHTTFWPIVSASDWCGEFNRKREEGST